MELLNRNAVSLKTDAGNMGFGSVEWVVRDAMQLKAEMSAAIGTECELRMELLGLPRSIHLGARITEIWPSDDGSSHIRVSLDKAPTEDRDRLEHWLQDQASGGTSVDPASWTQDLSGVHSRRGRKDISKAFRERRTRPRTLEKVVVDIPLDDLAAELERT